MGYTIADGGETVLLRDAPVSGGHRSEGQEVADMGVHCSASTRERGVDHRILRTMWHTSLHILDAFASNADAQVLLGPGHTDKAWIFCRCNQLRDGCVLDGFASGADRAHEAVAQEEDWTGITAVSQRLGPRSLDSEDLRGEVVEPSY